MHADPESNAPAESTSPDTLLLRLYVVDQAPNSTRARANIEALCNEHFPAAYRLEIVDVLQEPSRALEDGVLLTPTLLKISPSPPKKIVGTLDDAAQVLLALRPEANL